MYNPIGRSHVAIMKFPINTQHVSIADDSGKKVKSQVSNHAYYSRPFVVFLQATSIKVSVTFLSFKFYFFE